MRRRRVRFAAPFVLIIGCSGGRTTPRTPPDDDIATAAPADAPPDASIDAPPDAYEQPCTPCTFGCSATCNPPRPRPSDPPPRPPAAVEGRIIAVSIVGSDTFIVVGAGLDRRVDADGHVELVRDDGKRLLRGVKLEIVEVTQRTTKVRLPGGLGEARPVRVRLTPP
jgi:hypothetical protein